MNAAADFSHFVRREDDGSARMDMAIDGITCAACLTDIEGAMKRLPGVKAARLNLTNHRLTLNWDSSRIDPARMIGALEAVGYRAYPFEQRRAEADEAARMTLLLKCLGVAGFAAMNVMLLSISVWAGDATSMSAETRDFFHWLSALIALPAAAYAGQPFFLSALAALRQGRLNMDVPISIGVWLALAMSVYETANHAANAYFDSAIMLLLFLLAGRALDQAMRRKMRTAAGNLAALKGEIAQRMVLSETGEAIESVPVEALSVDDRILVRPGERIPADGVVLSGASEVDESPITGETARRPARVGETLYAGSVNFDGALTLRVTAAGTSALIDEVARLVETASVARSRYMRLADRVSRFYAPMVHLTAILTGVGWLIAGAGLHDAIVIAISVLVITCPCALALAVPTVQVMASGALFRAGLVLNAAEGVEKLAEVDCVIFDKTGTLTLPEPRIVNAAEIAPDLLALAARLARASRHPLAAALTRAVPGASPLDGAREETGAGVIAVVDGVEARLGSAGFCGMEDASAPSEAGASTLFFAFGARMARLEVRQALRVDARETVAALRARGLAVSILSGDRPEAVAPIAEALGVEDWAGALKPAEKIARVEALRAQGRRALMVGDGLNDAPALAAAWCSISPITAVDLAQAQADAVFLGERLAPVVAAIDIARRARALTRQNLILAVVYNVVAVPLAIAGFATPLIAAAAMSGSSIVVTLNALRLRFSDAPISKTPAPAASTGLALEQWRRV